MLIVNRPLIGILLDEDTSNGGRFYQTGKGYFRAIYEAGGAPIGLPYEKTSIEFAQKYCKGFLSTGARIKFPDEFYIEGEHSISPFSDRFEIEAELIKIFLDEDRPYFGICNGMQLLGALSGSKMTYQLKVHTNGQIAHDDRATRHEVKIHKPSKLHDILGVDQAITNSHHNEALLELSENIIATAFASDGTIEAIERIDKNFAIGVQWHPELLWPNPIDEKDNINGIISKKLFEYFVNCAKNA